jgi:hypothetical protein
MHTYWVLIRQASGTPMRVTVMAENNYKAMEVARALYGPQLLSENAGLLN